MNPIWSRTFGILALIALAALVVNEAEGTVAALAFACVVLLFFYLRGRRNLYKLWNWVDSGQTAQIPPASGMWEALFALLYRQNRAARRQSEALAEALIRFRRAGQALPEGVIMLDTANRITWFNAQAREHYGLQSPADTGQHIANLLRAPAFLAYLSQGGSEAPIVIRIRDPQNDIERAAERLPERVLSIQLVGYGDAQKLMLSRDVTQIEKLETMRRDFVANVSHELKTPLTVLSGFLETFREHELPPEQRVQYLKMMSEQAERMERLVSDLLTLSALESTRNLSDERVEMTPLLARIEATARQISAGKHTLKIDAEPGLNLIGAETELASAFTNLVTNAIRYTPAGGTITVGWKSDKPFRASGDPANSADTDNRPRVGARFSVEDTGIGIPVQHLPRLTERFYRVDRGRSRESGGTGLGLAIVKHVLTRHQARLEIDSTVGVGSRFTAVFPPQRVARVRKNGAENRSLEPVGSTEASAL